MTKVCKTCVRYLGENGRGGVAVASQFVPELVQGLQHCPLVVVLPQCPVSDQAAVVIQGPAEPGDLLWNRLRCHRVG